MAVGSTFIGSAAIISVAPNTGTDAAPVAGTYVPLSKMNTIGKTSTRNSTSEPVFMETDALVTFGPRDQSWSLGGFISPGDSGQAALNDAEASNDTVFIKLLYDGTNGFTQLVRVGTITIGLTPTGIPTITYAFAGAAPAVITGTGPLH